LVLSESLNDTSHAQDSLATHDEQVMYLPHSVLPLNPSHITKANEKCNALQHDS